MKTLTRLNKTLLPIILLLLTACDSVETVGNPFVDDGGPVNDGPAARDDDVRDFELAVWNVLKAENRCGQCHTTDAAAATYPFANAANVNSSFDSVLQFVNRLNPANSSLVTFVGGGHNCWETSDQACADTIINILENWVGPADSTTARTIQLTAPVLKDPGDSKNFPDTALENSPNSFFETIHPLLTANCIACHYEEGVSQQQAPFFANPDPAAAYEAVKSKLNIDFPIDSRLVQRLLDGHNCWTDCGTYNPVTEVMTGNADEMLTEIEQFAGAIVTTSIDTTLIISKALTLADGIIATGGNRHESNLIALWEFKTGSGNEAFDTSGIDTPTNLSLSGGYTWLNNFGVNFSGGKAQADTEKSEKLNRLIRTTGEYSIEAWVIPANVTQQDANIISYDAGSIEKNFALTQYEYSYRLHNRTAQGNTNANGEPFISTLDAGEILQSSLQHVVATYGPVAGRKIMVNGVEIPVTDPVTESTSISSWDDTFAFVLGNSSSNQKSWRGQVRMVAMHNRALTEVQALQNFEAGVGQKFFLLFSIEQESGIPQSYIRFEVSQFDNFSYLFENPTFINLNPDWVPITLDIQKIRIGINGKQALAGQSFASLRETVNATDYSAENGQVLSSSGAVIALEKGTFLDEFFLTFELLVRSRAFVDITPTAPPAGTDAEKVSDIGVRTFDEINATISSITGIPVTNSAVNALYLSYKQQLPTIEAIDAFLSSHQMAIAQLALTSCSERVEADRLLPMGAAGGRLLFQDVDFTESSGSAFNTAAKRGFVIDPVLNAVLSANLDSQPDATEISDLLGATTTQSLTGPGGAVLVDPELLLNDNTYPSLITEMNTVDNVPRTLQIVKAVCAAAVGSAAMLVQ